MVAYVKYGNGVEFFPNVEPDYGLLYVHARGNLSLDEMDALTKKAEKQAARLARHQVGLHARRPDPGRRFRHPRRCGRRHPVRVRGLARPQAGQPDPGRPAHGHGQHSRRRHRGARARGRAAHRQADPDPAVRRRSGPASTTWPQKVAAKLAEVPGVIDIDNGLPPPGVDWALEVDRARAARYGISPSSVGIAVQLITAGPEAHRLPAGRRRQRRRHPPAPAAGPAHAVGARRAAHPDRRRARCRSPTSSPACRNRAPVSCTASTACAPIVVQANVRRRLPDRRRCRRRSPR